MAEVLQKSATGITGFDGITQGGLPQGRTALVVGGPGCGKTLFGLHYVVAGATDFGEPGVFMALEETAGELAHNVASLGWDLDQLQADGRLAIDSVRLEPASLETAGTYDLEGLFARLGHAIDKVGAKRVVIDTVDVLFASLDDQALVRSELRRLFTWLKDRGVTALVTAEQGADLSRHSLEEYVSDCVVLLENRVRSQLSTRLLRIVKYRGSAHGPDEYPFLIDEGGFSVLPMTSVGLDHPASDQRVSSGIEGLDDMMGGGFFRGTSVLISGGTGAGKTSITANYIDAALGRGERVLHLAFEESAAQIVRNMRSIGITLTPDENERYKVVATRPTAYGLETHVARIHRLIEEFRPDSVIIDPLSAISGPALEVEHALLRLIDLLKAGEVTAIMTSLTPQNAPTEHVDLGISSIIDTWLLVSNVERGGERNRAIQILKSRGMAHSHQVREFILSDDGIRLADVYFGEGEVLFGSARAEREAVDALEASRRAEITEAKRRRLEHRRRAVEAQVAALRAELDTEAESLASEIVAEELRSERVDRATADRARRRGAEGSDSA